MNIVLDANSGRVIDSQRIETARSLLAPPGSTLKPLVLAALLESGKLRPDETFICSGKFSIEGRSFACVHPRVSTPIDLPTAIAYSCNEYVAKAARRFGSGELVRALSRYGLASRTQLSEGEATGLLQSTNGARTQLQALGEANVEITLLELASAYHQLAADAPQTVLKGLEDAVEFGTAQRSQIAGVRIAGKTGSAASGRWAWFAGFAPSRRPKVIVAVLTQGSSGGADAAPIARELLLASL
jgi:cell division protein FtsI/penicillin-binding protein 2